MPCTVVLTRSRGAGIVQLKQWHPKKEIKYLHGVDMFFEWSGPVGEWSRP